MYVNATRPHRASEGCFNFTYIYPSIDDSPKTCKCDEFNINLWTDKSYIMNTHCVWLEWNRSVKVDVIKWSCIKYLTTQSPFYPACTCRDRTLGPMLAMKFRKSAKKLLLTGLSGATWEVTWCFRFNENSHTVTDTELLKLIK